MIKETNLGLPPHEEAIILPQITREELHNDLMTDIRDLQGVVKQTIENIAHDLAFLSLQSGKLNDLVSTLEERYNERNEEPK